MSIVTSEQQKRVSARTCDLLVHLDAGGRVQVRRHRQQRLDIRRVGDDALCDRAVDWSASLWQHVAPGRHTQWLRLNVTQAGCSAGPAGAGEHVIAWVDMLTRTVTKWPMLADCTSRIRSCLTSLRGWMSTSYRRTSAGGSSWLGPVERCRGSTHEDIVSSYTSPATGAALRQSDRACIEVAFVQLLSSPPGHSLPCSALLCQCRAASAIRSHAS